MKKNIHPSYHSITVEFPDGVQFITRSTVGKEGQTIRLDIDPKNHPAWTGVRKLMGNTGQLAKFNERYQNLLKK